MDELTDEPVADLPLFPEVLVEEPEEDPLDLQDGATELAVRIEAEPVVESAARRSGPSEPDVSVAQVELPIPPPAIELVEEAEAAVDEEVLEEAPAKIEAATEAEPSASVTIASRFRAAAIDAATMIGVLVLLLAGGAVMGAPVGLGSLAFYLPTWLLFSFLYHVVPLLFWGKTPGMVRAGLVARSAEGGPLTGTQAIGRWLAGQATLALLGLPGLTALTGLSFADRVSGSVTLVAR